MRLIDRALLHPYRTVTSSLALGLAVGWHEAIGSVLENNAPAIGALATVVIAAFTITLWRATAKMQEATSGTLLHLGREFDAEHRPWIAVRIESPYPLVFSEDGRAALTLRFELENVGRIPAIDVRLEYGFAMPGDDVVARQKETVARAQANVVDAAAGASNFPGVPSTVWRELLLERTLVQRWRNWYSTNTDQPAVRHLSVVGCVLYRSPINDTEPYQTGFIREIRQARGAPIDPNQSADDLITTGSPFGTGAIT